MTVKSIPQFRKNAIVECFVNKHHTINELAAIYQRHRRTIIRVLEEAGVDPGIKHRVKKLDSTPTCNYQVKEEDFGFGQLMISVEPLNTTPQFKTVSLFSRLGSLLKKLSVPGVAGQ